MRHIRKLLYFVKPYWRRSTISMVLLIAVIGMDLAIPRLIQNLIDQGISTGDMQVILSTTGIMLGLSVIQALFALGNNILSIQVGEGVARDLREALFVKIQSFSFGNLDKLNTGQLMVRLSSDTTVFQRLVQVTLRIGTRAPLLMIGSLIFMFITDSRLAMMMIPILIVIAAVIVFFMSKMGPLFSNVQQRLDKLNIVLQENIAGVRLVKAFVRAGYESDRFGEANLAYTNNSISVMHFMATLSPAMSIFVSAGIVAVVWAGGLQAISGAITTGQLVAFINYLQTTLGPLTLMVMLANVFSAGTASSQRVIEILETDVEVEEPHDPVLPPEASHPRIEFKDVGFHYNSASDEEVLQAINLTVEPGQTVAILGATGAGKTSLINLVPRFYDASTGEITLNGVNLKSISQQTLLQQVGIVPQETVLFSGTILENIRYGRHEASEEEVITAAQAAQAHDFILNLPMGYDTHVEARGVNLSGGQKQRIAIARALLKRPSILILDDSTSSVDVATETKIQASFNKLGFDHTTFIVAQRISTVLNADKIVVLDEGHITAQGDHNELIHTSPIYQEIYDSQLGNGFQAEREDLS
jgi:ATP-binding cassette subfamily B multidrug efflux pump